MITGELKSRIDKLWLEFHTGGITNPLTVIEQITFLMFTRLLDIVETRNEKKASRTGKPFHRIFNDEEQELRWSHFKQLGAEQMLPLLRDKVFPHFKSISELDIADGAQPTTFREYFKDAQLMIQKETLLVSAVNMIDDLPLTEGDTKGDLYEYLLSKLTTAGINGQFRTPRHIIRLMVELLDPKPTEKIADPACGTGGFLVGAMEYLLRKHTSPEGVIEHTVNGKVEKTYTGDLLESHWQFIRAGMFHGFDFDATMLRIAAMNLLLHGVDSPDIHYQDTLSSNFTDKFPDKATNGFDVILANPPFKGSLDEEDVHPTLLRKVKTKKTELLFITLILRMLRNGGRCAVVVPDGVLFGSTKAHQGLRQHLVEENQLEGVISLPSGVFRPYAGVSTAIIIFTKGGRTKEVFFYDLEDDGFSLDDKRIRLYDSDFAGDLPELLERWKMRALIDVHDRSEKYFLVSNDEIREKNYELSINRYKKESYEVDKYRAPAKVLFELKKIESEIIDDTAKLEDLLK
ncbi:type I restriction-modification system subunit M [Methylomonas sp. SURF-2]|uniref:site-specific DNA-methyltransferase (adenine-specific) n=1 Tax=Methylomonas subterranea TaxID=2952225 RepID=A0ABT1TKK7_9GAMM|nr:class I SAM-dependent DNA methyltransferase [Methylomonas sp. SURF-2]MCQ8105990.1 type I restriction-modification system subunit M [Methylomonas sp. SURF-2]